MRTFFHDFIRADAENTPVCIEYGYQGECVTIVDCWRKADEHMEDAPRVELTDDERDRAEAWIMEHRWHEDHQDDDDGR